MNTLKSKIYKLKTSESGQSLLEIVVGLGIGALLIGTAAFVIAAVLKANTGIQRSQTAGTLSQELMDQVRTFGSADWQNIYNLDKGSGNLYFLNASGSVFAAQKGEDGTIDNDIRNGLIGYWKFNEGTGISTLDAAGQGLHGTISIGGSGTQTTSSEAWSNGESGKVGKAFNFDGTDDYIQSSGNLGMSGDAVFTVAHWIYWNGSAWTADYPASFSTNVYSNYNTLSVTWYDGKPALDIWNARFQASSALNVQTWYHVAVTKTAGTLSTTTKIYVNGAEVAGTAQSDTAPNITNAPAVIGRLNNAAGRFWNGKVDDVRVYNRALSADEVRRLYNSNVFIRSFYVENACRTNDSSSTISGVAPCGGGTADDPLTQKITVSTAWTVGSNTNSVTLADYLTRWKNAIFWQSDWSGGGDDSGIYTESGTTYASSTNIQITTSGSVRIIDL